MAHPAEIPVLPMLLAATPLPVGSTVPFLQQAPVRQELPLGFGEQVQVETFDPVARAAEMARQMPRLWTGTYQSFNGGAPLSVQLNLTTAIALGQMVDVRGTLTVGDSSAPVQGNLNAKSDQLDLLLLSSITTAGLEEGGEFRGLQGFSLSGWRAARFTDRGGLLVLTAAAPKGSPSIRGLW
ncbi:MAG: hypothetical protein RLZZ459_1446 [Cyanobacteriota bacterium]